MASFPKPLKDLDSSDLKELLADVLRGQLSHELKDIAKKLERIAVALEKKEKG